MATPETCLRELNIALPAPNPPAANYVPTKRVGNLVFISGQVPRTDGVDRFVGKLGRDVSIDVGRQAARLCALNVLSQLRAFMQGNLDDVVGCAKLVGFVNATAEFEHHPQVVDGASELMVEVFGESGRHSRSAVGCASLPRNVCVEIEAVFEVR